MISVCMTTYNGEAFLAQQLDSILPQLQADDEVLISDDGSTDQTPAILAQYAQQDERIRLLDGPRQGVIRNVESVLRQARGRYLFLADQDDIWLPNRCADMLAVFHAHPDVQLVLADLAVIDAQGQLVAPSYFALRRVRPGFWPNVLRNGYIGAGMAITAELQAEALPFPAQLPMHDMWLGALAGKHVALLPTVLTHYRRHTQNVSEIATTSSIWRKLTWRMQLLYAVALRKTMKNK